jgi:hypothetical protein
MMAVIAPWCWAAQPTLSLQATQPLAAFTRDHPPAIKLTLGPGPAWQGFVRVELFDLLSETTTIDYVAETARSDEETTAVYQPKVPYGIYRLNGTLVKDRREIPHGRVDASLTFAYAPAASPRQLPDDWPLGAHVTFEDPPLPGFKWYRYFSSWAEDNPAKDQYDWSHLDVVFARVRAIGGRLLIANDTTPAWTAPDRPVTRPWVKASTAYPPNDLHDLRVYLDALLGRYDDPAGTIGGLEVWNEANTPDRWQGTPEQLVAMARIFREAVTASQKRVQRPSPALVVGIAVSSGEARDYVQGVVKAGMLPYLDVVSGHWYEEMLSYDRATPINSLPLHVDLLAGPMHEAGFSLPIWNTESGIASVPRENGRIISQDELNRRASALTTFDPKQPWLLDGVNWRNVSERRAAASFVAGIAMLMSLGVEKTFVYSMRDEQWIIDGAPSLSWVALSVFGDQLRAAGYHSVVPVATEMENGTPDVRALAYRFSDAGHPGIIVAWTYQQDTKIGRPKLWQPWLAPQQVRLNVHGSAVEITDLYAREKKRLPVTAHSVLVPIGEEPVYLRELP